MSRLHRDEPPDAGVNAARNRRVLARPTFPRQRTIKFVTFRRGFTLLRIGGITLRLRRTRKRERGSWVSARRGSHPVSSRSPLRTGFATLMASGSAPLILLHRVTM